MAALFGGAYLADWFNSSQTIFTCAQVDDFRQEAIGQATPSTRNLIAACAAGCQFGLLSRRCTLGSLVRADELESGFMRITLFSFYEKSKGIKGQSGTIESKGTVCERDAHPRPLVAIFDCDNAECFLRIGAAQGRPRFQRTLC